MANQETFKINL